MKLLLKQHFWEDKRFLKFLWVGIINTIFGYVIYSLLIFFNIYYILAMLFSTVVGVLFNFKTIGRLVFNHKENSAMIKFIGVYSVLYALNIGIIKTVMFLGGGSYLGGLVAIVIAAPVAFILNKKFVFGENGENY